MDVVQQQDEGAAILCEMQVLSEFRGVASLLCWIFKLASTACRSVFSYSGCLLPTETPICLERMSNRRRLRHDAFQIAFIDLDGNALHDLLQR